MNQQSKSIVSVSQMARMVGLSRQRFHQLRGTTFPEPDYDPETKRPYYTEEKQALCLEVRQRNFGIDGKPILFYARRSDVGVRRSTKKPAQPKPKTNQYCHIIDGLRALGLSVSASQVDVAIQTLQKQVFISGCQQEREISNWDAHGCCPVLAARNQNLSLVQGEVQTRLKALAHAMGFIKKQNGTICLL